MKILHVAQSLKGGPASYLDEIIPHQIAQYGAENVVLLLPADDIEFLSPQTLCATILTFPTRQRSIGALATFASRIFQALRSVRPDIVHFHSTYAGAIGRLMVPFGASRPNVIYCAHGWAFDMGTGLKPRLFTMVERLLALGTDRIINISETDRSSAERNRVGIGKHVTILNGIADIQRDGRSRAALQAQYGMDPEKLNILFVGRFDHQKGFDIAATAAALLPASGYELHAIGGQVVSKAQDDQVLADNVRLLGWMKRSEIAHLYAAADVVIMPSRWEGFGLVAVEAMRAETPVLAAAVGALPELILDGQVGRLVDGGDPLDFARILQTTSRAAWQAMGVVARKHYLANFTADRLNTALDELYRQQLTKPTLPPARNPA